MTWWEERDWSSSSHSQRKIASKNSHGQAKTSPAVEACGDGREERPQKDGPQSPVARLPEGSLEDDRTAAQELKTSVQNLLPVESSLKPMSSPGSSSNSNSITFYRSTSQPEYEPFLLEIENNASRPSSELVTDPKPAPDSEEALFHHEPLDHRSAAIRLLQVRSSTNSKDRIECDIRTASTDDEYLCLSYTWGSKDRGDWIWINDKQFWARRNLWCFLHILRRTPRLRSTWIWIDALCIDQGNNAERTHQVQHMGLIYSKALEVVCWLGMSAQIARFLHGWRPGMWDELHRFCAAPYWRRAWVTQEIALAKNVALLAMETSIPLEQLPAYDQVRRPEYRVVLQRIADIRGQPTDRSLVNLLVNFKSQMCELPRDRIFSLRSLCWEGQHIDVDYTISDAGLTWKVLDCCNHSFCLCSMYMLGDALGTLPGQGRRQYSPNSSRVFYKHRVPHCAEVTLPLIWRTTAPDLASGTRGEAPAERSLISVFRTRKHKSPPSEPAPVAKWAFNTVTIETSKRTDIVSYKAVVCINLSSICPLFWGRLLVYMTSSGSELEFRYSGNAGFPGPWKWHWNYTVDVAKDATTCVVRIPLEIWFEIIVRGADVDHKGCCSRVVGTDKGGSGRARDFDIRLSEKSGPCCGIFDG